MGIPFYKELKLLIPFHIEVLDSAWAKWVLEKK